MAKARYSDTEVVDGRFLATYVLPVHSLGLADLDLLAGVRTVEHQVSRGDRLDHLAAKFYNDEAYWWVIALANGVHYPFASGGLEPGRILRVPLDVREVLDKIMR